MRNSGNASCADHRIIMAHLIISEIVGSHTEWLTDLDCGRVGHAVRWQGMNHKPCALGCVAWQ